ncbi:MAG: TIGR00730 family Rossman fold protein [Patescibacteria group bacterium]|jgi:hypothetical protein
MTKTYHKFSQTKPPVSFRAQNQLAKQRGEIIHPHDISKHSGSISWRIFRVMSELVDGYEFLSGLEREITIFGSARTKPASRYYQEAEKLGRMLANEHYTLITGGGPGIMEAANKGAYEAGGLSLGLNIDLPNEQRVNQYVNKGLGFHFFFTRKIMLSSPSQAFVIFPGGFGTLDEFFEVITLIQTGKMPLVPIILMGKSFWNNLNNFIKEELLDNHAAIEKKDLQLYTIVDSAAEAMVIIRKTKPNDYLSSN